MQGDGAEIPQGGRVAWLCVNGVSVDLQSQNKPAVWRRIIPPAPSASGTLILCTG